MLASRTSRFLELSLRGRRWGVREAERLRDRESALLVGESPQSAPVARRGFCSTAGAAPWCALVPRRSAHALGGVHCLDRVVKSIEDVCDRSGTLDAVPAAALYAARLPLIAAIEGRPESWPCPMYSHKALSTLCAASCGRLRRRCHAFGAVAVIWTVLHAGSSTEKYNRRLK